MLKDYAPNTESKMEEDGDEENKASKEDDVPSQEEIPIVDEVEQIHDENY